jgi:hypothetical protein
MAGDSAWRNQMFTDTTRPAKPGPLLPALLERIPFEVLSQFRMEAGDGGSGSGGSAGGDGGGDGKGGNAPDPKTFDQAAVDRIVADRLARDRASRADYDDLKKAKEELDRLKAEGQTEQEKALAAARKDAEDNARKDERSKSDTRILKAEVKALAGTKFASPTDALALLDLTGLKVGDDGEVDDKAITARLDQLLKDKPYLAASAGNGNGGGLGNLGQGQRQSTGGQRGAKGLAEAERRYGKKPEHSST